MRPVGMMVILLAVVFLGGALAAPWLYWGLQTVASRIPAAAELAEIPFPRVLNRAMLVMTLAGIWPFLRLQGFRNWGDLGFNGVETRRRDLVRGFLIGFASLAIVAVGAILGGTRQWNPEPPLELLGHLAGAMATAAAVGLMEEAVFRGGIFGALRRAHSWRLAMILSSTIYALAHFLDSPPGPERVTWLSGFGVVGAMFRGFLQWEILMPSFLVLTLAGCILSHCYERTGSLYLSVGLHAGWVFWIKFFGAATSRGASEMTVWFGDRRIVNGWLAGAVLIGLWFVLRKALCHGRGGKSRF